MLFCLVCGCGLGYRRLHTVVLAVLAALYTVTINCCEMLKLYVVATLMWQTQSLICLCAHGCCNNLVATCYFSKSLPGSLALPLLFLAGSPNELVSTFKIPRCLTHPYSLLVRSYLL